VHVIRRLLCSLLLPALAIATAEAGTVHHVNTAHTGCDGQTPCHASIQAAVNAAQPGDTVQIRAGIYVEQVSVVVKNAAATTPASRIVIQADPGAPVGSVVLHGTAGPCAKTPAIRIQQSRFVTIRGLTITGAGGAAIALAGQTFGVHIERNRIVGNGVSGCDGGITIAAGNVATLIVNNLILANGGNGVATVDDDGGPHSLVQNTIHGNGWNGVSTTRGHVLLLLNNAITGNGMEAGSIGGRVGVRREAATAALAVMLRNNLVCGNRLGEVAGPVLDGTDGANLTPTGSEGPGVTASPGCGSFASVYRSLESTDDAPSLLDDADPTPAAASPLIDRGLDPRTLLTPEYNARFEADYFAESVRPLAGTAGGPKRFDIGAVETRHDAQPPTVAFQHPAAANAHLRDVVTVQVEAADVSGAVGALTLRADAQELTAVLSPRPPAGAITATAAWSTTAVADGIHTLTAVATDHAGNKATATRTVIVDNMPPDTQITGGPTETITGSSTTFTFGGADNLSPAAGLTFAWRLDGDAFTPFAAATAAALSGLGAGSHTFEVKARDQAGNEDPSPARRIFTVLDGVQVTITEPVDGATVPSGALLVRGTVAPGGIEVGVTVNGIVAARHGSSFAAMVPVTSPSVTLTAVATAGPGDPVSHTVTVAVSDLGGSVLALRAHPDTGGVPLRTSFSLLGEPVAARIELDFDGDGRPDFDGPTLDGQTFTYTAPGLFFPRARIVDAQGAVSTVTALVQVLDPVALESVLQTRWSALRDALGRNDVATAVSLFAGASRDAYRDQLTALAGAGALPQVAADLGAITAVRVLDKAAEYELRAVQQGTLYSFHVLFVVDTDGVWRLRGF
jgi:hypothetical protein